MGWLKRIWQEGVQQGKGRGFICQRLMTSGITKSTSSLTTADVCSPPGIPRRSGSRTAGTPSGLIEIYSKTIADMNYDDVRGIRCGLRKSNAPTVGPAPEVSVASAICASGFPTSLAVCESETLRQQYTVAGKEPVFITRRMPARAVFVTVMWYVSLSSRSGVGRGSSF